MALHLPRKSQIILFLIIGLLTIGLVIQGVLVKQLYDRSEAEASESISTVIIDAVRQLDRDLPVEAQTGRRFIPSVRVSLPVEKESRILYRGSALEGEVWLSNANSMSQAEAALRSTFTLESTFKQVEQLQKCGRQVILKFTEGPSTDSPDKQTLHKTKLLKDGRTAYIYVNDCHNGAGSEPMLRELSQIESY